MNDQDYIRKAVELADGFDNQTDEAGDYIEMDDAPYTTVYLDIPRQDDQWFFDALAAQLVKQVDAMILYRLRIEPTGAFMDHEGTGERMSDSTFGGDRTMNTIKAVVDSEVLAEKLPMMLKNQAE